MKCLPGEILSKISIDSNACWNFTGGMSGGGYGIISFGKYTQRGAHIISHELYKGKVPDDIFVCHSCDNPSCVNPDHLFLGTLQTNKDDEVSKWRHAHGENHGCVKLTEEAVFEIRDLISKGYSLAWIGRKYNISKQAVYYIKIGKNWGWLQ